MAFKMKGSPMHMGTSAHKSALKAGEDKLPSYKQAYAAQSDEKKATQSEAEFTTAAKAYNTKKYGTTSPSADSAKKGATRAELAQRQKESPNMETNRVAPPKPTQIKTPKAEEKTLKASSAPKAPTDTKPAAKVSGGTRTKVTAKDGSKTISRGGRVVKTVDAKGNKTRYNKEGEETQGSVNRKNKKANKATASAENDASNARRSAEKDASRASRDKKVAEKKSNKRTADKISNDAKTQKYLDSNSKKRSDLNREADKLVAQSDGKLRKGQARRSIKRDNKRTAETTAQNAESTKKAKMNKVLGDVEKDVASSAMKNYKKGYYKK
jgi:hypothetical protein